MTLIYKKGKDFFSNEKLEIKIADTKEPKLNVIIKENEQGIVEVCKENGTVNFAINDNEIYDMLHREGPQNSNGIFIESKNKVSVDLKGLYYIKIKTKNQETMIGIVDYKKKKFIHCWNKSEIGEDHYETRFEYNK
ncbi:MAG: hypothetical protein QXD11_01080 [Candidatus Micrarchaeaceae archaeon]